MIVPDWLCGMIVGVFSLFFFKQKTAYEMRISDWSSDVCSSDLAHLRLSIAVDVQARARGLGGRADLMHVVHRFEAHILGRQIDVASRIHAVPLHLELV